MSGRLGHLLTHPLRHRLLLEYATAADCPSDVARRLDVPVNVVAYHTGVLARDGYVELVATERRRGATTRFYRSTIGPVIDDAQWAALPVALRRELAARAIDQLIDEARGAGSAGGFDDASAHLSRFPLELDDRGARDVVALLHDADAALAAIAADGHARSNAGGATHEVVLLSFETSPAGRSGSGR